MADQEPLLRRELDHDPWRTGRNSNIEDIQENNLFQEVSSTELSAELQVSKNNALLKAQGHKAEMERSFSLFAALGLGFSITNSWVGYLSCFGQNLAYAGPNSVVFGLCAAVVIQWIISLGLYEIASCFPSSGGQYHFVFMLAPEKYRNFAAFMVGWMNILGWSVALCSGISVVVASVSGLIAFRNPASEITQLQLYLLYVCVAILSVLPLFIGPRAIPSILQASLLFSVFGLVVILGLALFFRQQSQPLSFLFATQGSSGWGKEIAWMLGLTNSMYAFTSTDAAIHIAEEMINPERRLPQVLNMTLAIGFATSFPLLLFMMLSMTDADTVINSTLPYGELFLQMTHSRSITTLIMCWITLILFSCLPGQWVTLGRLGWAFARDGGLPYSKFFAQVSKYFAFPVRTTVLALVFSCCYGLLYLISTTAFNSIITSSVFFSNISYCVPQLIVGLRGRKNALPPHAFDLGWFGYFCNYLSPVFVTIIGILICFPPQIPLTAHNINYTPAVLVGCYSAMIFGWYWTGKNFQGPQIDWEVFKNITIKKDAKNST